MAEIAALLKSRHALEASQAYVSLRGAQSALIEEALAVARLAESEGARIQIAAEREAHLAAALLSTAALIAIAALAVAVLRLRAWSRPANLWRENLAKLSRAMAAGHSDTSLKDAARAPVEERSMPRDLALLSREISNLAINAVEHETAIRSHKDKLEHLNGSLRSQNRMLRKLGSLNERILNSISNAMLVLDDEGRAEQINDSFLRLFPSGQSQLLHCFGTEGTSWCTTADPFRSRRMRSNDGRWFDVSVELLPAPEGKGAGRVVSLQDITDTVVAEDRLAHAAKLTLAGTLSAQVAHELRNPLNSLILNLEMMEEDLPAHHPAAERLKGLMAQAERLERLTAKYLGVGEARTETAMSRATVDLGQFLEEALESRAPEFQARGVRVSLDMPPGAVNIAADPVALHQVMDNLITNALDAVEDQGPDRRFIAVCAVATPGLQAVITVEDGGDGVPQELESRIFEPFVTGKARGNGLGLSVSRQICLDHGGDLHHRGRSRFEVTLPC